MAHPVFCLRPDLGDVFIISQNPAANNGEAKNHQTCIHVTLRRWSPERGGKKTERNVRNAKILVRRANQKTLRAFLSARKRGWQVSDFFSVGRRKIYHINLIFITFQSLLLTREKWKIGCESKPEFSSAPGRRKKASAKIDFDVKIHVRIIMCSCHILCPSSNIPRRWFIEPENLKGAERIFIWAILLVFRLI